MDNKGISINIYSKPADLNSINKPSLEEILRKRKENASIQKNNFTMVSFLIKTLKSEFNDLKNEIRKNSGTSHIGAN